MNSSQMFNQSKENPTKLGTHSSVGGASKIHCDYSTLKLNQLQSRFDQHKRSSVISRLSLVEKELSPDRTLRKSTLSRVDDYLTKMEEADDDVQALNQLQE